MRWGGQARRFACVAHCRSCRKLLGLTVAPTKAEVRAAFLAAAWRHHPDSPGAQHSAADFRQLRSCYEIVSACSCVGSRVEHGTDNIHEDAIDAAVWDTGQAAPPKRRRMPSSQVNWAAARTAGTGVGAKVPKSLEVAVVLPVASASNEQGQRLPPFLWAAAAAVDGKGQPTQRGPAFCGVYRRTRDFNAAPAYMHSNKCFYLFWSQMFTDWKIAQRLTEKAVCSAFLEGSRDTPPWKSDASTAVQWTIWNPEEQRFSSQALNVSSA